tara:strand:+ start:2631 stop:3587 length:957 start_codon:yes stop_codon:yes gene_type:complete
MFKTLLFSSILWLSINLTVAQPIYGIDVSNWQGNIDWEQVQANGYSFAWLKATEGMTYTDPMFSSNISNGLATDIVMGAYHFARPDNNSALQDATNFLNIASDYIGPGFLPPVLDLENPYVGGQAVVLTDLFTSEALSEWAIEWMEVVENASGITPFIYVNGNYANYLSPTLSTYGLWFAQPDENTMPPSNIGVWSDWGFKQYSWWGDINGIDGDVDLNIFNGGMNEFNELIGLNTADLNHSEASRIRVYPNPVSSCLSIDGTLTVGTILSLNDMKGVIYPIEYSNNRIDLSNLHSGFYFLKIQSPESPPITIKISKK